MRQNGMVVYLLSSVTRRLYVGVTNDLGRRLWEHRHGPTFGFTRRYGNTIAARIGIVARDGLDACVYKGSTAPANKAPG